MVREFSRLFTRIFGVFFLTLSFSLRAEPQVMIDSANALYEKGEFAASAKLYQQVADEGYQSLQLFFNLGNAYFKQEKIGLSILNYHRALRMDRRDADTRFNMEMAKAKIRDKVIADPDPWFKRVTEQFLSLTSSSSWAWFGLFSLALGLVFWILLMSNRISFFVGLWGLIFSLLLLAVGLLSSFGKNQLDQRVQGVLLVSQVAVKSAPSERGEDMFVIHEGIFMEVIEYYQGWVKIRLQNNNVGWIPESTFEAI
ncbi:MAG: hypothetical protein EA358_06085 [Flavobacteriales bacterium]|nr:MAG: hypothetical protein EA358_06085 [Flavobacteriales bacterium]